MNRLKYSLFGIHRSGTNYLAQLLLRNFNAVKRKGYWKHSLEVPKTWRQEYFAVLIYKNPVTWTESIIRKKVDWNERQTRYPATKEHENSDLMIRGNNIENLVKTWIDFHDTWFFSDLMRGKNRHIIRYEDLLVDELRDNHLSKIQSLTGWKEVVPAWVDIPPGDVPVSESFKESKKEFYLKMESKILNTDQVKFIKEMVGEERLSAMGYTEQYDHLDVNMDRETLCKYFPEAFKQSVSLEEFFG